jgi:hypothetical protein
VFSLRPTAARYPLEDRKVLRIGSDGAQEGFESGEYCLGIYSNGEVIWRPGRRMRFTRFEVWRAAL